MIQIWWKCVGLYIIHITHGKVIRYGSISISLSQMIVKWRCIMCSIFFKLLRFRHDGNECSPLEELYRKKAKWWNIEIFLRIKVLNTEHWTLKLHVYVCGMRYDLKNVLCNLIFHLLHLPYNFSWLSVIIMTNKCEFSLKLIFHISIWSKSETVLNFLKNEMTFWHWR